MSFILGGLQVYQNNAKYCPSACALFTLFTVCSVCRVCALGRRRRQRGTHTRAAVALCPHAPPRRPRGAPRASTSSPHRAHEPTRPRAHTHSFRNSVFGRRIWERIAHMYMYHISINDGSAPGLPRRRGASLEVVGRTSTCGSLLQAERPEADTARAELVVHAHRRRSK